MIIFEPFLTMFLLNIKFRGSCGDRKNSLKLPISNFSLPKSVKHTVSTSDQTVDQNIYSFCYIQPNCNVQETRFSKEIAWQLLILITLMFYVQLLRT